MYCLQQIKTEITDEATTYAITYFQGDLKGNVLKLSKLPEHFEAIIYEIEQLLSESLLKTCEIVSLKISSNKKGEILFGYELRNIVGTLFVQEKPQENINLSNIQIQLSLQEDLQENLLARQAKNLKKIKDLLEDLDKEVFDFLQKRNCISRI